MTKDEFEKALTSAHAQIEEMRRENSILTCEAEQQAAKAAKLEERLQAATAPVRCDTYAAAVEAYGKNSQLIMAMEEMAELTKELSKNIRGDKNASAIAEEIADVEIMLEQLKIIFHNRAEVDQQRSYKLGRLAGRLIENQA